MANNAPDPNLKPRRPPSAALFQHRPGAKISRRPKADLIISIRPAPLLTKLEFGPATPENWKVEARTPTYHKLCFRHGHFR